MKVRHGNCNGCGRRGIVTWRIRGPIRGPLPIPRGFILTSFGGGYYCCNDACYLKAQESNT